MPVVDGNRAPYFVEGTDTTRSVPETAGAGTNVGDPVEALDLNTSDTLTYKLEDTSGKFSIDSGTSQITVAADGSLDYETAQYHELNVIVKDAGGLSDKIDVTVLVRDVDEPLVISGNTSPTFNENGNLNNSVARYTARDPEGSPITFTWSVGGTDGSDFSIDTGGNLRFNSQPDHETKDSYYITIIAIVAIVAIVATDATDTSNRGELSVTVTVTNVNEAPTVTGSASHIYQEIIEGDVAHPVAVFGFSDSEGNDVTWSLSGTDRGDFTVTKTSTGAGQLAFGRSADFESPADSGGNNVYNVTVVATDDGTPSQAGRLDVTVTVQDVNEAPSTPTGNASITVAENSTGNLSRYSSSDPERRTIEWSVTGTDADAFRIDASGNLAFDGAPDYENARDSGGNNAYDIAVTATDDGNLADGMDSGPPSMSASFDVEVTVTSIDEPPVITGTTTFNNWQENDASAIETYIAIDPEGNTPLTWNLGGTDWRDFTIAGGVLEFASTPDHEAPADSGGNNHYDVTIQATDSNSKQGELHVDVIVRNVDEPPELTGPDAVDNFPENSATSRQVARYTASNPERAAITWSLSGTDDSAFPLDNGTLTFKESPDYEDQPSYSVTVNVEAGGQTTSKTETINITNIEEAGAVTLSTVQPQAETEVAAELEDPDNERNDTWQWYRTSSRGSTGTAIDNVASGSNTRFYTPVASDVGSYLRAVASYDDGHGTGKSATAVSANRVQEAPPTPEPPVFPAGGDYARTISENTRAGTSRPSV